MGPIQCYDFVSNSIICIQPLVHEYQEDNNSLTRDYLSKLYCTKSQQ